MSDKLIERIDSALKQLDKYESDTLPVATKKRLGLLQDCKQRIEELDQVVKFYITKIVDNGALIIELHQERQFWEIANSIARIGEAKSPEAIAKRVDLIERTIAALQHAGEQP